MHGAQQHLWMHADSPQNCIWTRISTYTYTHIYVHTHIYTCIHIYTYTYTYTYAYTYTYIYTWIHIHIHTHIYVHIHLYTYIYIYLTHLHILYRAWSKCVRWCSQHLSNEHICTCMVLNKTCECMQTLRKNAYGLVHVHLCKRCSIFFVMEAIAILSWVLRKHHAGCRLPPALLPARPHPTPSVARRCSLKKSVSKSTLAHDAVVAAVLHKYHPIMRVGAGHIQFVYG